MGNGEFQGTIKGRSVDFALSARYHFFDHQNHLNAVVVGNSIWCALLLMIQPQIKRKKSPNPFSLLLNENLHSCTARSSRRVFLVCWHIGPFGSLGCMSRPGTALFSHNYIIILPKPGAKCHCLTRLYTITSMQHQKPVETTI